MSLGVVARYTLFFDGADYLKTLIGGIEGMEYVPGKISPERLRAEIARGHIGDGPCLRLPAEVDQAQLDEFEEAVAAAGLTERYVDNGFFGDLLWRWNVEWEAQLHELEASEGVVAVLYEEVGALDRLLLWLNHDKVVDALRGNYESQTLERAELQESALSDQEQEALRRLWIGCRACTTLVASMQLMDPMRHRATLRRMERIKVCLQERPILPLSLRSIPCIDDDDRLDAWFGELELDAATSDLVSFGADGMEGGSGWDADIRERIVVDESM
ncbi:MAG: hypothetical protein ACI9KE_002460 [Polyangiales bacterium]|jgi:hypothetical protein